MTDDANLEAIVAAVAGSRKYRAICPDAIRRIARRELASHGRPKIAIKQTRRKLHQVYGAFEGEFDYDAALGRLVAAYERGAPVPFRVGFPACSAGRLESLVLSESEGLPHVRAVCRDLLAQHSSTRERLPILDEFYPAIWAITGRPTTLLDLGCGLNPLAIPWMGLPPGARYHAFDIDAARVEFLNRYLGLAGLEPLAHWQDVLCQPPDIPADVALLLKTSPCLDRQEPDGARRVIGSLNARFVVVSFAVKSLAGREKGMLTHYTENFLSLTESQGWPVTRLLFATELVFVVRKDGGRMKDEG